MSNKTKYLYGASVQGIQGFIFQTNELKDIVGASALVDYICTDCFEEFCSKEQLIVHAAGNIKCIFDDEEQCKRAVREFPKKVMTEAPGITISEAVVKMEEGDDFVSAVNELEDKLRTQRNRPFPSVTTGLMGMERSRKTGLPAVKFIEKEPIDDGTSRKREKVKDLPRLLDKFFGFPVDLSSVPWYLEEMTIDNAWLAIIHADGNGLGEIVPKVGRDRYLLAEFSEGLDKATKKAAQEAYKWVVKSEDYRDNTVVLPFRPVVLGGDDLTIICRADLAIDFTRQFIKYFEEYTSELMMELKEQGADINIPHLTACAGIAYIKESYPFHYGYSLAEALCDRAKKDAKRDNRDDKVSPAPSCLMFYKVQSSFVESLEEMVQKELTPFNGHSFEFGPYYIKEEEGRWTVDHLLEWVKKLQGKEGNAIKSDIRQWMALMSENPNKAEQKKKRVTTISTENGKKLFEAATTPIKRGELQVYPAYDMLAFHSILSVVTKKPKSNS